MMLGVIPKDTHRANDARTHAYDLKGFKSKMRRRNIDISDRRWFQNVLHCEDGHQAPREMRRTVIGVDCE